jgi:uncharacterized protein (TIGR02145 family)
MELGMSSFEANNLGLRGTDQGIRLKTNLWGGTNSTAFSALPGRLRYLNGSYFNYVSAFGSWWTSTSIGANAWFRGLDAANTGVHRDHDPFRMGLSVRCIQDLDLTSCQDSDGDGVCAEDEVSGCTDAAADNFNAAATENDGSCAFPGPAQCGGASTVTFDGHTYALVGIGTQCWFAENLRSDNYRNGAPIPGNLNDSQWIATTAGAQSVYGEGASIVHHGSTDEVANLTVYGRLYNWHAVSDSRGLCPSNFHVPSDSEWMVLLNSLGGTALAGSSLKATPPQWDGVNDSSFSALPGGRRNDGGPASFHEQGIGGAWWSSTLTSPTGQDAFNWRLGTGSSAIWQYGNWSQHGYSVRCLRD